MAVPRTLPAVVHAARNLALACLVAVSALACGDDPNRTGSTAATAGLVILSGLPAKPTLTTFDAKGDARALAVPGVPLRWISAGRRGTLIATTSDGGLRLSDRVTPEKAKIGWRVVPGPDTNLPPEPLAFATWSGNGLRVAAVASDYAEAQSLVIVDPVGDSSLIIPLDGPVLPEPPAWLDEQRVGVPTPTGLVVVDASTSSAAAGPAGVGLFAVSADWSTAALQSPGGNDVEIRATGGWLAGNGSPEAQIAGEGDPGALALDRRAARLAIVWERGTDPGLVVVYGRAEGWREIGRVELPGRAVKGSVSWLP